MYMPYNLYRSIFVQFMTFWEKQILAWATGSKKKIGSGGAFFRDID